MASTTSASTDATTNVAGRGLPERRLTVARLRDRLAGSHRVFHPGSLGMITGGVLAVVGAFLPWVATPLGSLSGLAGAGLWTLAAGFVAIAGAFLPYRRVALGHCAVTGLACAGLVGWQLLRLLQLSAATEAWGSLLPGMGLVMTGGAAVVLLRTGWRLATSRGR